MFACQAFIADAADAAGHAVNIGEDDDNTKQPITAAAANETVEMPAIESLEQQQSILFQARKAGFTNGIYLVKKDAVTPKVFVIKQMTSRTNIVVAEMKDGEAIDTTTITADSLFADWKVHKGIVATLLEGWSPETAVNDLLGDSTWQAESAKGACHIAMRQVCAAVAKCPLPLKIIHKPNIIKTSERIATGTLLVAPASMRLDRKETATSIPICKYGEHTMFMSYHFSAPSSSQVETTKSAWVCPFWWVTQTAKKEDANLNVIWVNVEIAEHVVCIPIMVSKQIAKGIELKVHKAALKSWSKTPMTWGAFMEKYDLNTKKDETESPAKRKRKA